MVRFARLGLSLSPLVLVACSTEPTATPLVGRWGSRMLELVSRPTAVELHLACGAVARFRGPLHPDEGGRFHLAGQARQLYGGFRVELVGQVHPDRLSITLTEIYDGGGHETSEEELLVGVTPDFPGVICLG